MGPITEKENIMYINSNLTPREVLNLYGTLPAEMCEQLIDTHDEALAAKDTVGYIEEAKGCYPTEDCLNPVLELLNNLHRNLRKSDTKEALRFIIERAEELQSELSRSGEYGASELKNALDILESL
jgi:hypothetical protein